MIVSKVKQTLGFEIPLTCEDGDITHTLWITSGTRERVQETFREVLGVSLAKLQDEDFITNKLADFIEGTNVEFTTIEQEYNGNYKTVVQWLNKPGSGNVPVDGSACKMASAFFSGKAIEKSKPASDFPQHAGSGISDDDIPF